MLASFRVDTVLSSPLLPFKLFNHLGLAPNIDHKNERICWFLSWKGQFASEADLGLFFPADHQTTDRKDFRCYKP